MTKTVSSFLISLLIIHLLFSGYVFSTSSKVSDPTYSDSMVSMTKSEYDLLQELPSHEQKNSSRTLPHRPADFIRREPRMDVDGIRVTTTESFEVSQSPLEYLERYNVSSLQHLAWSLDYNPSLIYYYVRNNIDYEPYFGPMAGPDWTLLQGGGNSFDQASLLVALLRESGIAARYVYGTIEVTAENASKWLRVKNATLAANLLASSGIPVVAIVDPSGNIIRVRLEHAWAEAYLPYQDFRGQMRSETGYSWIPLDPSFKTYEYTPGMELPINSTYASDFFNETISTSQYNETEGWITGVNETFVIEEMNVYSNETFEDILADLELSNRTFMQLFGFWELDKEDSKFLPSTLPYDVKSVLGVYSEFPQEYHHEMTFKIGYTALYTALSSEIAGKRVTVSFIPATDYDAQLIDEAGGILNVTAYLVNMKPVLMIDGEPVAEGSPIMLGDTLTFTTKFTNDYLGWLESIDNTFTVGAYYAIVFNIGKVSSRLLREHTADLNMTNYRLSMNEAVPKDDVAGELLYVHGLTYFHENDFLSEPPLSEIRWYRPTPAQAIVSMDLIVWVDWLGNPVDLDAGGMTIDVGRNILVVVGKNSDERSSFMLWTGMMGSGAEYAIFEQLHNITSISAMKILREANNRNVSIYTINQSNLYQILPALELPYYIKGWIESDVNAGRIVVTPAQEIQIEDWHGAGWVVIDPATGAGGYYISGGLAGKINGGSLSKITSKLKTVLDWMINAKDIFKDIPWDKLKPIQDVIKKGLKWTKWLCFLNYGLKQINIYKLQLQSKLSTGNAVILSTLSGGLLIYAGWAMAYSLTNPVGWALVGITLGGIALGLIYDHLLKPKLVKTATKIIAKLASLIKHGLSRAVAQAKQEYSFTRDPSSFEASSSQTDPITRGKDWLTNAQAPEGYWGYISEVKHTSFATITLSEQGYIFSNATDWLLEQQNPDGSWSSLESTCYAVWALSRAGIINDKGVDFILASQNPDGGWGGHINTSLAVISLNYSGIDISNDTITWLLNAQNPDGGWGMFKSAVFDTSLVLKALTLGGVQNEKGIAWLKAHQGADSGWTYEDSTALALDILLETDFNCTLAIQWLLERQNLDGGWGLDRSQSYTTAKVVHALWKFDPGLSAGEVQWLLDNQNPDGGWGFSREISCGFLRDTVLAGQIIISEKATTWVLSQQEADGGWGNVDHTARAIVYLDDRGYDTGSAVSWLVTNQNPDGGWGLFSGYGSGTWETALALKALAGKLGYAMQRTKAINWLLAHQNPDGGWGFSDSDIYITSVSIVSLISAGYSPTSTELQGALAWLENQMWSCTSEISMMLLSFYKTTYESDVIDSGIQWLLDNQNLDGGWGSSKNHTSTPYHTSLAVAALEAYYKPPLTLRQITIQSLHYGAVVPLEFLVMSDAAYDNITIHISIYFDGPLAWERNATFDFPAGNTTIKINYTLISDYTYEDGWDTLDLWPPDPYKDGGNITVTVQLIMDDKVLAADMEDSILLPCTRDGLWDRMVDIIIGWPGASLEQREEMWNDIVKIILLWPAC